MKINARVVLVSFVVATLCATPMSVLSDAGSAPRAAESLALDKTNKADKADKTSQDKTRPRRSAPNQKAKPKETKSQQPIPRLHKIRPTQEIEADTEVPFPADI